LGSGSRSGACFILLVVGGWGQGLGRDLSLDRSLFLCCRIRTVAPWILTAASANLAGSLGKGSAEALWEIREEQR